MTTNIISNNTAAPYIGTIIGVIDGKIDESAPTTVAPTTGGYLNTTSFSAGFRTHSVIRFPTTGIGTNQDVSNADLNIRVESGAGDFAVYQLKNPFVSGQVSWNERSTGVAWVSNGGLNATDVDTTPLVIGTASAVGWLTLNSAALTALVNGWVKETILNYGLLLTYYPDTAYASNNIRFFRSDPAYDNAPSLVVTHATAVSDNRTIASIQRFNASQRHTFGTRR